MKKLKYGTRSKHIDVLEHVLNKKNQMFTINNAEFLKDPCQGTTKYLQVALEYTKHYYLENTTICQSMIENPPIGDLWTKEEKIKNPIITFIIPTIGRETLQKAIQSLVDNESKIWKAIVVFDGIPILSFPHPSILSISIPKVGFKNCAGDVRNKGIKLVTTEWIGFLDDDDTITQDYLYRFQSELDNHPNVDVIIFRMINTDDRVIPSHTSHLSIGNVGISFAIKSKIFQNQTIGIKFEPNAYEDFHLLDRVQKLGYKIHISNFITYLVR